MNLFQKASIISVVVFLIILSACAENSASNNDSDNEDSGYPTKPVTIYVNYSAGGNTDLNYRQLANVAEKYLGQTITIQNVTGGGGTVGLADLSKAKPDGYTLGNVSLAPLTVSPHKQNVSYEPDSFTYLGGWGKQVYGLVVSKDSPYETLEEFIEGAKENPGSFSFSDPAPGGLNGLAIELLDREEDNIPNFKSVPYEGGGEATAAVLGNHVDFTSNNPAPMISGLESGELRLLASLSDSRIDAAPDVPTVRELGYDFDVTSWFGLGGPSGLPDEVIEKWTEVLEQTVNDPEFIEAAEKLDTPLEWMSGEEYENLVKERYEEYGEVIKGSK